MPPDEIAALFAELLDSQLLDILTMLEALCQLANRQWQAYAPLAIDVQQRVDEWLTVNWDSNSLTFLEAATSLVGLLGLPRSWATIRSSVDHPNAAIAAELRKFCTEMERGDPLDPWSGMPKP